MPTNYAFMLCVDIGFNVLKCDVSGCPSLGAFILVLIRLVQPITGFQVSLPFEPKQTCSSHLALDQASPHRLLGDSFLLHLC